MKKLFLIHFLLQNISCQLMRVYTGQDDLLDYYVTKKAELSFEKKYWYKGKEYSYLLIFDGDMSAKRVCVLLLPLPFSSKEMENENMFKKEPEVEAKLRKFFYESAHFIYTFTAVVKVILEENLFFRFETLDEFKLVLNLANNKLFLYSTFELKEFNNASQSIFNPVKYGIKYYKQNLLFDGAFSSVEIRYVYIAYDRNGQNVNPVVRRFPFYYNSTWTETIVEQQNVFLKQFPIFDFNENKLIRTKQTEDKFTVQVSLHEVSLAFDLHESAKEGPDVRIKGIEVFDTALEPKKLKITKLQGVTITLSDMDLLHVIVPGFQFEGDFDSQKLMFLLFYRYEYEVDGFKRSSEDDVFFDYPLDEPSFVYELETYETKKFYVKLEKFVENNDLLFLITVLDLDFFATINFELPIILNEKGLKFQFVYMGLNSYLGTVYNGAIIRMDPEIENDKEESNVAFKKTTKSSEKIKNILLIFVVLLCLTLFVIFVLWKKNII